MPRVAKEVPIKHCAYCQKEMFRKSYPSQMEVVENFKRRKFCDQICMAKAMVQEQVTLGGLRSRAAKFRKSICENCGTVENLQIHHMDSNPANNALENLRTFCATCHLKWHWANGKVMPRSNKKCLNQECERLARHGGYCGMHYVRFRKNGDSNLTRVLTNGKWILCQAGGRKNRTSAELPQDAPIEPHS